MGFFLGGEGVAILSALNSTISDHQPFQFVEVLVSSDERFSTCDITDFKKKFSTEIDLLSLQ